ncbi:MAG: GTP 3',8-cyclase MoaA [Desulfobacterales bacterium]|nr:GTP 3',8-cyclase MoaA [Desulfobacterales bacterium]
MTAKSLEDCHHRRLNYLRISVTDRCNLRCIYCVPRETLPRLEHTDILRYEEILRLVRIGVSLGIDKIRITGGEPLVRKGLMEFLQELRTVDGIREINLTTNAVLVGPFLEGLHAAGIRRLNISLDTLRRERFARLAGRDCFDQVWANIRRAGELGFAPLKINVVAMRGINDDEFETIAALTRKWPFHIRFIEYMPMGNPELGQDPFISNEDVRRRIATLGRLEPVEREASDGPAERFRLAGALGEIGFISPRTHHFCGACNRLRLTANGHLRPCLLSDRELDIKTPMRCGADDGALAEIFARAARAKPSSHQLGTKDGQAVNTRMNTIGG